MDIAGLVKGASKGEGLGNKFLSHIREVDAIVHVVRCFDDANITHVAGSVNPARAIATITYALIFADLETLDRRLPKSTIMFLTNITHVDGSVNPARDIETINYELIFADMETLERRMANALTKVKADKKYQEDVDRIATMQKWLESGKPLRNLDMDEDFKQFVDEQFLLTSKPVIYVANTDEAGINGNKYTEQVERIAKEENTEAIVLCAKLEEDLSELSDEDRAMFMEDYGLKESGLDRLVKASYKLLGLISYLTAGEKETRAWTIVKGTKAPQAAGKIHSEFERGFIRAEIVDYATLLECGSFNVAKERGKVRSEGKDYVMQDNDVVLFRINV